LYFFDFPGEDSLLWSIFSWIEHNLGDVLNFIGFSITVYGVWKSKAASERAEIAAKQTREQMRRLDLVIDFSEVISLFEEIKIDHRERRWKDIMLKYQKARNAIVKIRSMGFSFSKDEETKLNAAFQNIKSIEKSVEKSLHKNLDDLDAVKFNSMISDNIDMFLEIFVILKNQPGENNG
jgi:hypothetical protein